MESHRGHRTDVASTAVDRRHPRRSDSFRDISEFIDRVRCPRLVQGPRSSPGVVLPEVAPVARFVQAPALSKLFVAERGAAGSQFTACHVLQANDAGAEPGARNSRKSRPHQRHPGSGLYGASGSPGRFRMAEMDLRVMGMPDRSAGADGSRDAVFRSWSRAGLPLSVSPRLTRPVGTQQFCLLKHRPDCRVLQVRWIAPLGQKAFYNHAESFVASAS